MVLHCSDIIMTIIGLKKGILKIDTTPYTAVKHNIHSLLYLPILWLTLPATIATSGSAPSPSNGFGVSTPDARPVSFLSPSSAVINWETCRPCATMIQLREGTYPAGTPGCVHAWTKGRVIDGSDEKTLRHSIMLTALRPATKYFYRVYDPGYKFRDSQEEKIDTAFSAVPRIWRREYAFITPAEPGSRVILRIPIKVLIIPNVVDAESIIPGASQPDPMSEDEIETYKREFRQSALIYFINSRMRYWIDMKFYVKPDWYRVGPATGIYKYWPELESRYKVFDPLRISRHQLTELWKDKTIFIGQTVVACVRKWDPGKKQWFYQGSGGGTLGVAWLQKKSTLGPIPGRSSFLGGSDISWLNTHEFHHQMESQYRFSGLTAENDRLIFCHYAPKHTCPLGEHWKWDTAYSHGRDYDGISWSLRALTDTQYLRNIFAEIYVTEDRDRDGVPDNDPLLPLDEVRFGSDPKMFSTDGSGMSDLHKIMTAKWHPSYRSPFRDKVYNPGYLEMWALASGGSATLSPDSRGYACPQAKNPDSDGDGIRDADDPYPIYPWTPQLKQAHIRVDGTADEWESLPVLGHFHTQKTDFTIKSAYDREHLYYLIKMKGPIDWVELLIDGDADGWYAGNENLRIELAPDEDGKFMVKSAATHLASSRSWPYFDTDRPIRGEKKRESTGSDKTHDWIFKRTRLFGDAEDVVCRVSTSRKEQVVEIAIPNGEPVFPIRVAPAHTLAHAVYAGIAGRGPRTALSVYEPGTLFTTTAE